MELVIIEEPMENEKVELQEPSKDNIIVNEKTITREDDLVFKLLHFNRMYNADKSIPYFKGLYKEIDTFRKNTFLTLSAKEIAYVKLLSEYKMTEVKKGIKEAQTYFMP